MAGTYIDICGPILGATVYSDNILVARDCEFELPEIAPATADIQASGTLSLPIIQLIDNMEATIKKIGVDAGLRKMIQFRSQQLEVRFVQQIVKTNGMTTEIGCKAFIRGIPSKIPGLSGKVGEAVEAEAVYNLLKYQLYADGVEQWCVDRTAGVIRIAGVDYAEKMNSLL
ncbi:phage major tail tube protein [Clostridiales Family XIII bacterium ASD5510]|uniref:Phage major tail tube protein n=2 Tax=Bacteria TaxID=2 RepID=A0A9J6QVI6_9FIRM|nr:phage major tail tube protein [Hominibacterium faecale]MCU7378126.1 phage major tail tube protein [Hominibacterium faecale]